MVVTGSSWIFASCGTAVQGAFCQKCGTRFSAAAAPLAAAHVEPVKRKTSPVVWMLVAVAGIIVLCLVGLVAAGLVVAKNPGMVMGKLITAGNPDADVLGTDLGSQTVRIRDRKTGEVFTLSFDDVKNGKFKISATGENGTGSAKADQEPRPLSTQAALANVTIKFNWRKVGLGLMEADFTIRNYNSVPVKDLEITCTHSAPSGTVIDRNTRTIYEVFQPHATRTIEHFNMGFIHAQAAGSGCEITDLVVIVIHPPHPEQTETDRRSREEALKYLRSIK